MKRETLCTIATIIYHLLFLSGASFYVTEFQKTRDVIIAQADRVGQEANKLKAEVRSLKNTGSNIDGSIKSLTSQLQSVKNSCNKLRF